MKKALLILPLLFGRCEAASTGSAERPSVKAPTVSHVVAPAPAADDPEIALERCQAEREHLLEREGLPGTPGFEAERLAIFSRVKAEPVLFVQKPAFDPGVPKRVRQFRGALTSTPYAWDYLKTLVPGLEANPKFGRQVLLRDGYLYAEDPKLAYAFVDHVRAHYLFDEPRIWIQRGDKTFYARRGASGQYSYETGPNTGEPVQLLLLDRIGQGDPAASPPPLHRDLRSLRYRLHFDAFEPVKLTERQILANLRYGGLVVPTILRSDGARLELQCEIVEPGQTKNLALHREREARLNRVVQGLRAAMISQIQEKLPFDEPMTESGQQDGFLRMKWQSAYTMGQHKYKMNGDDYYVFDVKGRPLVPQVCIDFLTDTFERSSGTWFTSKGGQRQRQLGKLDFQALAPELPRRVPDFVEFARRHHEWFDVYDTPPSEQISFRATNAFYSMLKKNTARYRPGDIVVIRGYTPFQRKWEVPVMHYHSFFVYESDPLTGVPIIIVGNAGRPSLRTWEFEVRRTPKRSIWHRIRPHLFWLEQIVVTPENALDPPPLTVGPALG